jgi:hypothetical protein
MPAGPSDEFRVTVRLLTLSTRSGRENLRAIKASTGTPLAPSIGSDPASFGGPSSAGGNGPAALKDWLSAS